MRNVSDKFVEKLAIHVLCSITFFFNSKFMPFMRQCEKNIVEWGRSQMTIWRMRVACWITKATNTHAQVVKYFMFFHYNIGCTKSPQCHVIHKLPVLLHLK